MTATEEHHTTAHVLVEALPYIRRFAGKTVVVKYGGNALAGTSGHDALDVFAQDIVLMRLVGLRPVVVHGGGPQISALMDRLGKTPEFRDGLRVTDAETVDIARMVLIGQVNPQLVTAINLHGNYAVGVSGEDAGLIKAVARDPELGFVGDILQINPAILERPARRRVHPRRRHDRHRRARAGVQHQRRRRRRCHRRGARRREADLPDRHRGPASRRRRPGSLIRQTTADELDALVADGTIAGGMIPKVASCVQAVRNGVGGAHILDGRIAHVLLLEIFTDAGIGTMVLPKEPTT